MTFTLRHHERVLVQSPGAADHAGRARRVAGVFGSSFIEAARWVEADATDMRLWGWLGPPDLTRSQTDLQYVYVNGRVVRDRLLAHALRQAYQDALAPGRHPMYALHFEIAPALVDVNVHPTKHEVRFRDARSVHDFVFASVRRALADHSETGLSVVERGSQPAGHGYRHSADRVPGPVKIAEGVRTYSWSGARPKSSGDASPLGRALGLVGERFLLAAESERLVVVDVACAQRLLWRRSLLDALATGNVVCRPLLIPATVTVSAVHADVAEAETALLGRVGIDVSRAGAAQIMIRGVPSPLAGVAPESLVLAALEYLSGGSTGKELSDTALIGAMVDAVAVPHIGDPDDLNDLLRALAAAAEPPPGAARGACWAAVDPDRLGALFGVPGGRGDVGDEAQ